MASIKNIPCSAAAAAILTAFLPHGIQSGSMLFASPDSRFVVFAAMFVCIIGMCPLRFLWIRIVVKVLTIPARPLSCAAESHND